MVNPQVTAEELLMAPNSALKLQTNRYISLDAPPVRMRSRSSGSLPAFIEPNGRNFSGCPIESDGLDAIMLSLLSPRDGVGALSYRMLECPDQVVIAQVDNKGLVFSGSLAGSSSLLITSQETFGVNQTLILAVKVSCRAADWRKPHMPVCSSGAALCFFLFL